MSSVSTLLRLLEKVELIFQILTRRINNPKNLLNFDSKIATVIADRKIQHIIDQ